MYNSGEITWNRGSGIHSSCLLREDVLNRTILDSEWFCKDRLGATGTSNNWE